MSSSSSDFVLVGVGDALLLHPISAMMIAPEFSKLLELLRTADVAIGNCEISGFDTEGIPPGAECGGVWLNGGRETIEDFRALGFTMMSRANNHAVDFGVRGMSATDRALSEQRIAHAGTGATLDQARAPVYATTRGGRTALISATDTAPSFFRAGQSRPDMIGRPGLNLIRSKRVRIVDPKTFEALAAALDIARGRGGELGAMSDDGREISGLGSLICKGDHCEETFVLSEGDVENNLDQVRMARRQADHVVFALHTHLCTVQDQAPKSIRKFATQVIEAGADVVFCHGPHCLRGIEVSQGRPIFYSLGNFAFQVFKMGPQPTELYEHFGLDSARSRMNDLFVANTRQIRAVQKESRFWESVIARIVHQDSKRFVELHPIELSPYSFGAEYGTPRMATEENAARILANLTDLSAAFGTRITQEGGIGVIDL